MSTAQYSAQTATVKSVFSTPLNTTLKTKTINQKQFIKRDYDYQNIDNLWYGIFPCYDSFNIYSFTKLGKLPSEYREFVICQEKQTRVFFKDSHLCRYFYIPKIYASEAQQIMLYLLILSTILSFTSTAYKSIYCIRFTTLTALN